MKRWHIIEAAARKRGGFISTAEIEKLGISRPMIRKYVEAGYLEAVRKGLYALTDEIQDEYALLQARSAKIIFSYGTALFLWGMSDRAPHIYDITVPWGTNMSRLTNNNRNLRCHYVQLNVYEIGITETISPQGAMIKLYDKERCICDLIRDKENTDMQLYTGALKEYFGTAPNARRLLKYGKIFGVEKKIRTYMEVLL